MLILESWSEFFFFVALKTLIFSFFKRPFNVEWILIESTESLPPKSAAPLQ